MKPEWLGEGREAGIVTTRPHRRVRCGVLPLWHSVIAGTMCLLVFYDLVCPQHMLLVPCFLLAHGTASDDGEDGGVWRGRRGDADGRRFDDGFACHGGPTAGEG